MKLDNLFLHTILFVLFIASSGCEAENMASEGKLDIIGQQEQVETFSYLEMAKKAVKRKRLTELPLKCLEFVLLDHAEEYKAIIDVREVHNDVCKGDLSTSPRLFSIAFDKNGNIWSDARSLLGQLEKLD